METTTPQDQRIPDEPRNPEPAVTPVGLNGNCQATAAEPPVLPAARTEPVPEPFRFHGTASEYFRIWIVNTLLTLLTLGLFAAWAKVRKRRYLRGSTELMRHRFDYRADPRRILLGNFIVVVIFLAYSLLGAVYPVMRYGAIVVAVVLLPWIVVRSLAFNAHNTAYRGMRFHFRPPLSPAIMTYLIRPLLIIATLGFYFPAWARAQRQYTISHHKLGDAYFSFEGGSGPFYAVYLLAGLLVFAAAGAGAALMTLIPGGRNGIPSTEQLAVFLAVYGLALFVAKHYIHARLFNHIWNHTKLDEHGFSARLQTGRWLGLQLTNLGAIIISCGLLYPWAVIRSLRYTADCMHFHPAGPIENIQRLGGNEGSAVGDTAAEFIGLDFGL